MDRVLKLVKEDMLRHMVNVVLPGSQESRDLILNMVTAKVNRVAVLEATYGDRVTDLHGKLARKIYGEKEEEVVFGAFIDPETLAFVFVFSRELADFDRDKSVIVFKDLDEVLLKKVNVSPTSSGEDDLELPTTVSPIPAPPQRPPTRPSFPGGTAVRYSLPSTDEA